MVALTHALVIAQVAALPAKVVAKVDVRQYVPGRVFTPAKVLAQRPVMAAHTIVSL